MGSRLTEILVDRHDPAPQAAFWAAALGYHVVRTKDGQVEIAPWEREPPRRRWSGLVGLGARPADIGQGEDRRVAGARHRRPVGVRPRVVVLSREELARVVADNPFPDEPNPKLVHAVFRNGPLSPEELAAVDAAQERARGLGSRDEARVVGTTLYLHTPDGFGRSELAAQLTKAGRAGTAAKARNWATVRKLLDMCGS